MISLKKFLYKNSVAWGLVLLWMSFIFILSSVGNYDPVAPVGPKTHDTISTVVHIFLYFILMALSLLAVISYPRRHEKFWHGNAVDRWQYLFLAFSIAVFYGLTDEWHQIFVAGRESSPIDWLADILGTLMALFLIIWYVKNKSRKTINKI